MVYITSHISGFKKTWSFLTEEATYQSCLDFLVSKEGCRNDVGLCLWNGRNLVSSSEKVLSKDTLLVATVRLRGGKGGFGSMLRAIGAQIEKTTNREACRDLSGRRLRDINEEKRLKEYLAKKVEVEKETLELKRKKLEKLKEGPKHFFEDKNYLEQREKSANDIHKSMDKAFSSQNEECSVSGTKRKNVEEPKFKKRKRLLDDLDNSSGSDSDEQQAIEALPICSDMTGEHKETSVAL